MHLASLPNIEVTVSSGGVELKEYDDPHELEDDGAFSDVTAHSYVEAIDGAEFTIRVQALPSYVFTSEAVAAGIYIDGIYVTTSCILCTDRELVFKGRRQTAADGTATLRRFVFSSIKLTEDENDPGDPKRLDNIGEIKVILNRVYCGDEITQPSNREIIESAPGEVSEKQLKGRAISHGTSYGQPEVVRPSQRYSLNYLDHKPLAILKILYRSKAALEAMLLIPHTPSPQSPSSLRRRSKTNAKVPSAQDGVKIKSEKKVKRERDNDLPSGHKKKRRTSSAVIDLTQDDDDAEISTVSFKQFETEDGKQGIDLT